MWDLWYRDEVEGLSGEADVSRIGVAARVGYV